jgi:hypothetical protein
MDLGCHVGAANVLGLHYKLLPAGERAFTSNLYFGDDDTRVRGGAYGEWKETQIQKEQKCRRAKFLCTY